MALEIIWSPRAVSNFENICTFIERDSRRYAALFAKRINGVIRAIPSYPKSGRVVPEYGDDNLREKIYENYRIVYRMKEGAVEIVAICHGAKPLDNIL